MNAIPSYLRKARYCFFLIFISLFIKNLGNAQPTLSLTSVITSGLTSPIEAKNAGDGSSRVFIVQKGGTIRVYSSTYTFLNTFLTVSGITTSGERGLLSMAFPPNYASFGYFFVYYTNANGDLEIARYHISGDPNVADASSKTVVLTIPHPTNSNHNGGELHFGSDGYLYLSTGDGGGAGDVPNNAQTPTVLLGKLLRLSVNTTTNNAPYYTIPAGNPYSNEVYCLGLRNPFRWSFDPLTNDLWIGDVGQNAWEEIDFRAAANIAGTNFGWRCYEGNATYNTSGCQPPASYIFPVYVYSPASSVMGGVVYRGSVYPALQGYYVGADHYSGNFYKIYPNGGGGFTTTVQTGLQTGVTNFGVLENGEIVVVSLTQNKVSALVSSPLPLTLVQFSGKTTDKSVELSWKTDSEHGVQQFEIEFSTDGFFFEKVGTVAAKNATTGATYQFSHRISTASSMFYRLKMLDFDGDYQYSEIQRFNGNNQSAKTFVYPSLVNQGGSLSLFLSEPFQTFELFDLSGRLVLEKNLTDQTGRVEISVSNFPKGTYLVRLKNQWHSVSSKVVIQ